MFKFTFFIFGCTLTMLNVYSQTSYGENMCLKTSSSIDNLIQSLDLTDNQLTFIPDEVLEQIDIEKLWIDDNQIQEIPEAMSHLGRREES